MQLHRPCVLLLVVAGLIGGDNVGETVEGLARFPINVRYPREWRDTIERLIQLPIVTQQGAQITLGMVTAPLLSLFVIPAAYGLMRRRQLGNKFVHNTEDFSERL